MTNKRRFHLKEKMILYKGGKCVICNYNKCKQALEFHHLNGTKKFNISGSHSRSWEAIKKELSKCILVCSNCHAEIEEKKFGSVAKSDKAPVL